MNLIHVLKFGTNSNYMNSVASKIDNGNLKGFATIMALSVQCLRNPKKKERI
jgi:hypothetical protein